MEIKMCTEMCLNAFSVFWGGSLKGGGCYFPLSARSLLLAQLLFPEYLCNLNSQCITVSGLFVQFGGLFKLFIFFL